MIDFEGAVEKVESLTEGENVSINGADYRVEYISEDEDSIEVDIVTPSGREKTVLLEHPTNIKLIYKETHEGIIYERDVESVTM